MAFGISVWDSVGEMFDLIPRGGSVAMENTSAALAWAAAYVVVLVVGLVFW